MDRVKIKLIAGFASVLMLGSVAVPAFGASTIVISAAESSSNVSINSNFNNNFPFAGEDSFDEFIMQFFGRKLRASMDGAQEIPGPGDPDGTGEATVKIKPHKNHLCVDIETKYIDTVTGAHIHHAPRGSAGAVVLPLPVPDSAGEAHGCIDAENNLLKAIKQNPEDYYVNVHTNAYPNGAIRGQLSR